jgi:hypothetical protein
MSRLTHQFTIDDIRFPAFVGPDGDAITAAINAGHRIPPAVTVTAVLDTGTNITAISPAVEAGLGLHPIGHGSTRTASGPAPVPFYYASIGVPPVFGVTAPVVIALKLKVCVLDLETGIDVLFGLDLLLNCRLFLDGPARTFTLDF